MAEKTNVRANRFQTGFYSGGPQSQMAYWCFHRNWFVAPVIKGGSHIYRTHVVGVVVLNHSLHGEEQDVSNGFNVAFVGCNP